MIKIRQNKYTDYVVISLFSIISGYFLYSGNTKLQVLMSGSVIGLLFLYILFFYRNLGIKLLIIFTPLSISIGNNGAGIISFPTEIGSFLLFGISIILVFLGKNIPRKIWTHPISILLLLDLGVYLVATVFSSLPEISIKRLVIRTVFIGVYFFSFTYWLQKERKLNHLFVLYAIGLTIPIIYTLIIHSAYDYSQFSSFLMGVPFYTEHTVFGACIAFVIPFLAKYIFDSKSKSIANKALIFSLFILLFITLILTYSRASWISVIAVLLFSIGLKYRIKMKHIILILTLISSVVYVNFDSLIHKAQAKELKTSGNLQQHLMTVGALQNEASNQERINRWVSATRMFKERPLTGFGPGTYQFKYGPFQSLKYKTRISTNFGDRGTAHSEYFTALSETGIFGFILFFILVFYSLNLGMKLYYKLDNNSKYKVAVYGAMCGLLTFYIHGLFNNFLDTEKMSILVYGSLAVLVAIDLMGNKNEIQSEN